MPAGTSATIDKLRRTFLFETFSDDQLRWLAERTEEVSFAAGERFLTEGEPADALWVLLEGEIEVSRALGGREFVMATGSAPGTWSGWLPVFDGPSRVSTRTLRPSLLLRIGRDTVRDLLAGGFPVAAHLMAGITYGIENFQAAARQQEKLAALGKLSAGLAHELNNPAAAALRAIERLHAQIHERDDHAFALGRRLSDEQTRLLIATARDVHGRPGTAVGLTPLERSDREEALGEWLDGRGVADGYDLAPIMVDVGIDATDLVGLAERIPAELLPDALTWLGTAISTDALAHEVAQSLTRMSDLVRAIKDYSYMDRASEQEIDVHQGIDDTLKILAYKLRGVTVERLYAPSLPHLRSNGSDLNQVWTNLLDNAVDAVKAAPSGDPRITIRTATDSDAVLAEIADNGGGIPPEVQPRVFEPFFTTKPMGEGTGLGLDISYRIVVGQLDGELSFASKPGETRFTVRLPLDPRRSSPASAPESGSDQD